MEKPQDNNRNRNRNPTPHLPSSGGGGGGGGTIIASCALAAAFLILLSLALTLSFFLLFRPRDPQIHISSLNLPHFSPSLNSTPSSFYFSQYASVRNPNRAAFSHYDSSLQLLSAAGSQIGFMYVPAGEIAAGQTVYMSASFPVNAFPFVAAGAGGVVEVESRMRVKGRVRVLMYFTHHVEAAAGCRVGISSSDGSVLGYRC